MHLAHIHTVGPWYTHRKRQRQIFTQEIHIQAVTIQQRKLRVVDKHTYEGRRSPCTDVNAVQV